MKKFLIFIAPFFMLVGCGQKPIVIQGKIDKPNQTVQNKHRPSILGKPIGDKSSTNPLENPSVLISGDTNTTIPSTTVVVGSSGVGEEVVPDEPSMDPTISQSYVATLRTKKFSFSDAAFMREENGVIDLQILSAGKPLVTLKISSDVCVDHNCISKEEFNHDYLSSSYPPDLINNVLTQRPIFEGKNLKRTTNGFMQKIYSPRHEIRYKTTPGSIYFKDLKNNIVIKLRRLQ